MQNHADTYQTQIAATCILLSVADADEILEDRELDIIREILQDFFSIDQNVAQSLINDSTKIWESSTDLFQFGTQLNQNLSYDDKLDFINCVFEVAYADGDLHYLEHHTIKKIANIFNLNRTELIAAKVEIESYLD